MSAVGQKLTLESISADVRSVPKPGFLKAPRTYNPAIMATIKGAFHDVWQNLEGDLTRDPTHDQELKAAIIRRLLDLVEKGITSQEELRERLLRYLPLG